jgi:hypothetical protein
MTATQLAAETKVQAQGSEEPQKLKIFCIDGIILEVDEKDVLGAGAHMIHSEFGKAPLMAIALQGEGVDFLCSASTEQWLHELPGKPVKNVRQRVFAAVAGMLGSEAKLPPGEIDRKNLPEGIEIPPEENDG